LSVGHEAQSRTGADMGFVVQIRALILFHYFTVKTFIFALISFKQLERGIFVYFLLSLSTRKNNNILNFDIHQPKNLSKYSAAVIEKLL